MWVPTLGEATIFRRICDYSWMVSLIWYHREIRARWQILPTRRSIRGDAWRSVKAIRRAFALGRFESTDGLDTIKPIYGFVTTRRLQPTLRSRLGCWAWKGEDVRCSSSSWKAREATTRTPLLLRGFFISYAVFESYRKTAFSYVIVLIFWVSLSGFELFSIWHICWEGLDEFSFEIRALVLPVCGF